MYMYNLKKFPNIPTIILSDTWKKHYFVFRNSMHKLIEIWSCDTIVAIIS